MRMTVRRVKIFSLIGTLVFAMVFPDLAQATPVSFDWGSFSASGQTTFGVYDIDGATILQTGDLAQFIWAGPDGLIDPPLPDGSAGGDDQILDISSVQNGGSLPPPSRNKGYITLKTYTFDNESPQSGGTVYIRAWNSSTSSSADAYGDSSTGTLGSGSTFNAPQWHTNYGFTTWTGPEGGDWDASGNWSGGEKPDANTYAILPGGSSPILTADGVAYILHIANGAVLDLAYFDLRIENRLTNHGALRQTKEVDSSCTLASPCRFLNIQDASGEVDQYYGVDIASENDLGNVEVTIQGNASACTLDPESPHYVQRCYTITPETDGAATVWLWALVSEQNGIAQADLAPYRNVGGPTWEKLTQIYTGDDGNQYIYGRGETTGFSSFLLGDTNYGPTAVAITALHAASENKYSLPILLPWVLFFAGGCATFLLQRRRTHRENPR